MIFQTTRKERHICRGVFMNHDQTRTSSSQKGIAIACAFGYYGLFFGMQILCAIPVAIVYVVSAIAQPPDPSMMDPIAMLTDMTDILLLVTVLSNALTALTCFLVLRLRGKSFVNEIALHPINRKNTLLCNLTAPVVTGFALSIATSLLLTILMNLFTPLIDAMEEFTEQTSMLSEGNVILTVLTTVVAAPLVEELIFRGLIYTRLRRAFPMIPAMLASALLFGLAHGTVIHMLYTVPLGVLMCVVYERYRSLWAPILLHFGFNVAGTAMTYYTELPYWFIAVCLLLLVFGIVYLCLYKTEVSDEMWNIAMTAPQKSLPTPVCDTQGVNMTAIPVQNGTAIQPTAPYAENAPIPSDITAIEEHPTASTAEPKSPTQAKEEENA